MSRTRNLVTNIKWSYIGTILTILLGFVVRTVFIYTLGVTMLGINSLFASILGVLSIAELGIGPILNTQLYKPVAEDDTKNIIGIVQLYKKIYTIIAVFIAILGISIIPFIDNLIKGAESISNIEIYYLFFLFNSVITYFVSYKFSISNAEQKNYINTNFDTIFTLVIYVVQICVLIIFKNYLIYIFSQSLVLLTKTMFISFYMNKKYPVLTQNEKVKLEADNLKHIKKNIFAGIVNKFSDTAINQTDNMIISAFINVNTLGIVSNYTTLRTYLEKFTKPLLDNSGSIVGNFVNTESRERKKLLMKALQLYSFWIYGFSAIVLFVLASPFVQIWLGDSYIISSSIVLIISFNLMLSGLGDRPYVLFKNSHGIFYDDWFVVLATALVNLIATIILVFPLGILGVFLGTTATILLSVIWMPLIFYKKATGESVLFYFGRLLRNYIIVILTGLLCLLISQRIQPTDSILLDLLIRSFVVMIIPNTIWICLFYKTNEFTYLKKLAVKLIKNKISRQ